jgi:hypothetical protein
MPGGTAFDAEALRREWTERVLEEHLGDKEALFLRTVDKLLGIFGTLVAIPDDAPELVLLPPEIGFSLPDVTLKVNLDTFETTAFVPGPLPVNE